MINYKEVKMKIIELTEESIGTSKITGCNIIINCDQCYKEQESTTHNNSRESNL